MTWTDGLSTVYKERERVSGYGVRFPFRFKKVIVLWFWALFKKTLFSDFGLIITTLVITDSKGISP